MAGMLVAPALTIFLSEALLLSDSIHTGKAAALIVAKFNTIIITLSDVECKGVLKKLSYLQFKYDNPYFLIHLNLILIQIMNGCREIGMYDSTTYNRN